MDLLVRIRTPLMEIAMWSGFSDQAAFTHIFHRVVGVQVPDVEATARGQSVLVNFVSRSTVRDGI
jgi:AraC-like DNA-binding protein